MISELVRSFEDIFSLVHPTPCRLNIKIDNIAFLFFLYCLFE